MTRKEAILGELHAGIRHVRRRRFVEVSRPTLRRAVMRIDFSAFMGQPQTLGWSRTGRGR